MQGRPLTFQLLALGTASALTGVQVGEVQTGKGLMDVDGRIVSSSKALEGAISYFQ